MAATCKNFIRFSVLLGLLSLCFTSFAQPGGLDPEKWAIELNKKGKDGNDSYGTLDSILVKTDSIRTFEFLDKLAAKGKNDYRFRARFNCLKAHQIYTVGFYKNRASVTALARKAE